MTLHFLDHIVFALIALIFPVWDSIALRKRAALIHAGHTELRMKLYHRLLGEEWASAAVIVAMWFLLGRNATALGLVPQGGLVAVAGYALTAIFCVLLILQAHTTTETAEGRASIRKHLAWLSFLTPRTRPERKMFNALSVTAGVCEEVIFRGYLTAYFAALFGLPLWAALVLSSIVFGVAHMYQGPLGVLRTGAVGGAFAVLYLMTGSLWAPIVAHAVMDLTSGHIAFVSFNKKDEDPEATPREQVA